MKKKIYLKASIVLVFMLILITITMTSCKRNQSKTGADGRNEDGLFVLRMITQTTFSETIIAHMLGFFEDEGIKAEFVGALGRGITQFQGLELGEIDVFTQGHLTTVGQARLSGINAKAVAPGFVDDPDNPHILYLVREDSHMRSLKDLPGAKVAVNSVNNVCTDGFVKKYLTSNGMNAEDVEFVFLSAAGQAEQSLVMGQIDVTTSHTPFGGKALAAGGVRVLGRSWDIWGSPWAGLAVRGFQDKFIEEHPDVVQGFVNATYRARIFMINNPEYSQIVGAEYLGLDPSEVSSNSYDWNKNIRDDWAEEWLKLSVDMGFWNEGDLVLGDLYTNQFVPKDAPKSDSEIAKKEFKPR